MSQDLIGPALPPGFRGGNHQDDGEEEVAGPVLPPGYRRQQSSDSSQDSEQESPHGYRKERNEPSQRKLETPQDDDDEFFGPALPPGFRRPSDSPERPVIGPALPPGFKRQSSDSEDGSDDKGSSDKYKTAADDEEEDDDDDVIGPLPAKGHVQSSVAEDIERRAWKMKQKLTSKDEPKNPTRESWMTELPPDLTNFGLGPRTFKRKTNDRSGDRSDWTDTPADRERKAREKQEGKASSSKGDEVPQVSERDKKLAEQVSTYNDSKRSESLIDLHRKKLKRKADEGKDKPKERRPFDREEDLKVNRFDDAQKKALLRKSKELNTKFSHGNSSMFL